MATTSDTAAQTARGNGVNKLFTSKDLTPAQRRLRWVIIGIWVILAYGAVCVLVGSAPWTIWRLYGGLAALGVPLLVLVFWFPVVWAPGPAAGPGPCAPSGALHAGGGGGFAALEAGCRRVVGVSWF